MKIPLRILSYAFLLFSVTALQAGTEETSTTTATAEPEKPVSLDLFSIGSDYVFQSDLNHGGSFGQQYALQTDFNYSHRFLLTGHLYLRAGLSYDRFDFGHTDAPVPVHLQAAAGMIGVDYMHGDDVGAFLYVQPGIYTEEHIGISSFDAPITLGRIFVLQEDKLYILLGAEATFLRGRSPVVPFGGIIWIPNKDWRVMAVPPNPRVIYSATKTLDLWVGGELVGYSFRTDNDSTIRPTKLSGAQVDYEDYRAGVGLAYSPSDHVSLDFATGYSIERGFKFHRAGENYRTDPSPYLRFEFRAKF